MNCVGSVTVEFFGKESICFVEDTGFVRCHYDSHHKIAPNDGGNKFIFPQKLTDKKSGIGYFYYFPVSTLEFDDKVEEIIFPEIFCKIPDGIKGKNIKTVVLPKQEINYKYTEGNDKIVGLKVFPTNSFLHCPNLKELDIPEGYECMPIISDLAKRSKIERIKLPMSIKYLQSWCFTHLHNIREIVLPDSIEYMGEGVFASCKALEKVNFPIKIKEIPDRTFSLCENLEFVIPKGIKTIGNGAFSSCQFKFTSLEIPDSVIEIKDDAFSGSQLKEVFIDNLREKVFIGHYAFSSMTIVHFKDDKQETTKSQTVTENIVETKSLDKSVSVTPKKENKKLNIMAKKSAISGEYVISVEDSGSIVVYRIFDNVKASLREAAELKGFEYDSNWNTRQFGSKLCKEFGDGKSAEIGNYFITVKADGGIETYRTYDNTKEALRTIAENIGFIEDPNWNTRQFGSKLIDEINK